MKILLISFFLTLVLISIFTEKVLAKTITFNRSVHFTKGSYKIDNQPYRKMSENETLVLVSKKKQKFVIQTIKTKDLVFYTLKVLRGNTQVLQINDFAITSNSKKISLRKEAWIEDANKDGFFDIIQREKTYINSNKKFKMGSKRKPASLYKNDKLVLKLWNPELNIFVNQDNRTIKFEKALKKFNFNYACF